MSVHLMSPTTSRTTPPRHPGATPVTLPPQPSSATPGADTGETPSGADTSRAGTGDVHRPGATPRRGFGLRGMLRGAKFVATYTSLLLCCATAVFWARSILAGEGIVVVHGTTRVSLSSTDAVLILVVRHMSFDSAETEARYKDWADPTGMVRWDGWRWYLLNDNNTTPPIRDARLDFGMTGQHGSGPRRAGLQGVQWLHWVGQAPHWAIFLLTLVAPSVRLHRMHRIRRDRIAQGLCRKCGFPMGDVYHSCPECGERLPITA